MKTEENQLKGLRVWKRLESFVRNFCGIYILLKLLWDKSWAATKHLNAVFTLPTDFKVAWEIIEPH